LIKDEEHKNILFTPQFAGIDFFGNRLFSSAKIVSRDDELVRRFVEASLKGFKYAMTHPEEMADYIFHHRNSQNKSLDHLLFEYEKLNSLTRLDLVEAGYMSVERWKNIWISMHRSVF